MEQQITIEELYKAINDACPDMLKAMDIKDKITKLSYQKYSAGLQEGFNIGKPEAEKIYLSTSKTAA